jgi:Ca-activated chloride channel family protein
MWNAILTLAVAQDETSYQKKKVIDFSDVTISGEIVAPTGSYVLSRLSAAPGGAQDIEHFRSVALSGVVPYPGSVTFEGLLRQHDLPTRDAPCGELLCPIVDAAETRLISSPGVTHLVHIGFTTGLRSFRRSPLHLVALVDRSGSMAGGKLELVKRSLRTIVDRLTASDRISLVAFADGAEILVEPSPPSSERLRWAIGALAESGSTNIDEGLRVAFDVARRSRAFDGTTRVMLFTDEQPNVGRTDEASFRSRAEVASLAGVGLTTIGVGADFGASLATAISAVRGGNLFYFPDADRMAEVIAEDFDTMVTELGHDLELHVRTPASRVAGVYGVPESIAQRSEDEVRISVKTLFASKRRGAIFIALEGAPEDARVSVSYTEAGGRRRSASRAIEPGVATGGLTRGASLIDEAALLRRAAERFHQDRDATGALASVRAIFPVLDTDAALARERPMLIELEKALAAMAPEAELTALAR